jgi:hypothetical protein
VDAEPSYLTDTKGAIALNDSTEGLLAVRECLLIRKD